ncbi:hypothetical protein BC643_2559 [Mangrovibacterium diazotrophicum]|uniref:Uncharacterized protein n=1 Tax=Mangrovibacterium diazotrophicum TaxID=1261403 RepID=A0A419W9R9_9BACT|nr:hypothetical protein BC643_2559 [Mangrovibacterium diazotrophicum]
MQKYKCIDVIGIFYCALVFLYMESKLLDIMQMRILRTIS